MWGRVNSEASKGHQDAFYGNPATSPWHSMSGPSWSVKRQAQTNEVHDMDYLVALARESVRGLPWLWAGLVEAQAHARNLLRTDHEAG